MDFIHDRLSDGRSFRTLNLTEAFTRQCLAQEVDTSLSGIRVVRVLEQVKQKHGVPELIRLDNGSEFRSKALDLWAYANQVNGVHRAGQTNAKRADRIVQRALSRRVFRSGMV